MKRYATLLLLLSCLAIACSPAVPPEAAGAKPAPEPAIERISDTQIRIPNAVKFDTIVDGKGGQRGFSTIARDNGGITYIICACQSGCQDNFGNACKLNREDPTGSTILWCTGSCSNSENRPCGGCVFTDSPTPPPPSDSGGTVGVDVTGGQQPGVDSTPDK